MFCETMEIKPIKLIPSITQPDLPESKVTRHGSSALTSITLSTGQWQYLQGHLILNGKNIGALLEQSTNLAAPFLNALAHDLQNFLNHTLRQTIKKRKSSLSGLLVQDEELASTDELGRLAGLVEAYIAKIMRLLKRKYDETTDGLSFLLDEEGQLIVNGMNVSAFVQMSRQYPSSKARLFLKGLKNRLGLILSNKSGNSNYEKIREVTERLFCEIDLEVQKIIENDRLLSSA